MPTSPGYHPDVNMAQYPVSIRAAISKIAQNFYVTRSFKSVQIGNSVYWALLVRPTDEFSVYINTDREVLVLLADYSNFEIRTLEAFDEFYDLLESKRVDKSIRFLVSADSKIVGIVKHYLDQHPEYPIIIPVNLSELQSGIGNHLLEAVRKNYLIRDLFGYQNPLREETFFFGRQDVVNNALDMARSGQNSSIFGLRKSGKTSAIYAIQRKAKGFSCNVAIIDCQNPTVHARNYAQLLAYLIGELRKATGMKHQMPDLGNDAVNVSENFFQRMNTILSATKDNILLIFDEIENISPNTAASPHWRTGNDSILFWQVLRAYCQTESKGRLSICIVGTSPHILETPKINGIDNPIYLFAPKRFIPSLSFDETREMVSRLGYFMGLEFPPVIVAEIQKRYGGHPFFTRQVCSKIHLLASHERPLIVSERTLSLADSQFSGQLDSYLKDIVDQLRLTYPEEFAILRSVVDGNSEELNEFGREAPDLIDHVIGYGLVEEIGDEFQIKFDAVRHALERLISKDQQNVGSRWLEISERRNRVETEIRMALYHWSRAVSSADWKSTIDSALTKKRLEALTSIEPNVLFSSSMSPLYLSDLLMFLKDSTVLPYLDGRRGRIVAALDCVNKFRRDAHAIKMTSEEMDTVRAAFEELESEFATP